MQTKRGTQTVKKIENIAIAYQACSSNKSCGKCYQIEGKHCNYYDCETSLAMRCGLFLPKTAPNRKDDTVKASEKENDQLTQGSLF